MDGIVLFLCRMIGQVLVMALMAAFAAGGIFLGKHLREKKNESVK